MYTSCIHTSVHINVQVSGCQHKVLLKGICVAEDKTRAKRAALEGSLAAAERDHTVQELVDEVGGWVGGCTYNMY